MKNKKYKNDLIAVAVLLITGLIMCGCFVAFSHTGQMVQVKVDGDVVKTLPLNEDSVYEVAGENDSRNLLVIKNGKAHISEASCPDGLCIGMGEIDIEGQSVVCLPNKVVVEIISDDGNDAHGLIDAVAK